MTGRVSDNEHVGGSENPAPVIGPINSVWQTGSCVMQAMAPVIQQQQGVSEQKVLPQKLQQQNYRLGPRSDLKIAVTILAVPSPSTRPLASTTMSLSCESGEARAHNCSATLPMTRGTVHFGDTYMPTCDTMHSADINGQLTISNAT